MGCIVVGYLQNGLHAPEQWQGLLGFALLLIRFGQTIEGLNQAEVVAPASALLNAEEPLPDTSGFVIMFLCHVRQRQVIQRGGQGGTAPRGEPRRYDFGLILSEFAQFLR